MGAREPVSMSRIPFLGLMCFALWLGPAATLTGDDSAEVVAGPGGTWDAWVVRLDRGMVAYYAGEPARPKDWDLPKRLRDEWRSEEAKRVLADSHRANG